MSRSTYVLSKVKKSIVKGKIFHYFMLHQIIRFTHEIVKILNIHKVWEEMIKHNLFIVILNHIMGPTLVAFTHDR